ncbi:Kinesin-like protein [Seminavis robusta]|uniref:Kinesin-like protein n=1 Tax=Seminavis robusta TaxID=568900 RepID=A0A9N8EIV0_9STRA|nr:Kinesin-like protein [Seminavis robusta]|eukprot:Sro1150_g246640.1 Kinesin-like protein (1690) ;mRNA; f:11939-17109
MASSPPGSKKRSSSSSSSHDAVEETLQRTSSSNSTGSSSTSSISNKRPKHDNSLASNSKKGGQNVRVVARVRPLSSKEVNESSKEAIGVVPSLDRPTSVSVNMNLGGRSNSSNSSSNSPKLFEYDGSFGPATTQQEVYEHTVGDMIRTNIFKGFNVTVMAYGQTGSGKTFTMGTEGGATDAEMTMEEDTTTQKPTAALEPPSDSDGIIPRAVYDLFEERQSMKQDRVTIEMSYLEIYNEEALDLLVERSEDGTTNTLQIRDSRTEGVVVQNLSTRIVTSPKEVAALMAQGSSRRATASTAMNAASSRSHAICTLYVTIAASEETDEAEAAAEMRAKLTLVDLAGSERIKRTGAEGNRMKEGININKGLFVLGQCVSALSELGQKGKSASSAFIPYRDSKLTRLLQDSLGGNSKTIMVACISPADSNVEESVNTLRYASRTRNIQNSAVRNVVASNVLSVAEAAALKRENESLKQQLAETQAQLRAAVVMSSSTVVVSNSTSNDESLKQQLAETQAQLKASRAALVMASSVVSNSTSNDTTQSKDTAAETDPSTGATTGTGEGPTKAFTVRGMDMSKLDKIQQLQSTISSLESQVEALEGQQQSSADDALEASLRADKWQMRCENILAAAKQQNVTLDNLDGENSNETDTNTMDLVAELRKEIASLKSDLHDALADAAVARATAAAVVANSGDLSFSAESMDSCDDDTVMMDPEADKETKLALTAELVAVSGGIEAKEAMAIQINRERECMEAMRHHFENAVKSLQEEVEVLAAERSTLIEKVGDGSTKINGDDTKRMRKRVDELEARIKDLRQQTAEHKKSLRLREAAEKKCAQLAKEIQNDKRRRVVLQKQLKEQASERRSEKMAAKKEAAKFLRDSNKLKAELQKVKDAAAKQAAVLRRKATEAMQRQKRETELKAKKDKLKEERQHLATMRSNAKAKQSSDSDKSASASQQEVSNENLSDERQDELTSWLDNEIDAATAFGGIHDEIKKQKQLLSGATARKLKLQQRSSFSRSSGNIAVDPPSSFPQLQAIDEEIEMRSNLLEKLEQNLQELSKPSVSSPLVKGVGSSSSGIINNRQLNSLSQLETKTVFVNCFERVIELRNKLESAEARREHNTTVAVNSALAKQRRTHEEEIMTLKMEHSEAMMNLLNSTKGSIEQTVRLNTLNKVVDDEDFQATVEDMLSGYLEGCNKVSENVQVELRDVKQAHEGMKTMVEAVASDIIQKSKTPAKKKKKVVKQRNSTDSMLEEIQMLEQDEAEEEDNSDDSDWSPSRHKTPGPKRRSRRSGDSPSKDTMQPLGIKTEADVTTIAMDTTMEPSLEDSALFDDAKDSAGAKPEWSALLDDANMESADAAPEESALLDNANMESVDAPSVQTGAKSNNSQDDSHVESESKPAAVEEVGIKQEVQSKTEDECGGEAVGIKAAETPKQEEDGVHSEAELKPAAAVGIKPVETPKQEEDGVHSEAELKPAAAPKEGTGLVETLLQRNYEKHKVRELKDMLRARGLTVSGNKSDLISRLRDNDKEEAGSGNDGAPSNSVKFSNGTKGEAPATRRSTRARGALQPKDFNKGPGANNTKPKAKAMLPETPPQSTHKGGGWSTKKTASVRRSTVFERPSTSLSAPSSEAEESPVNDKENDENKAVAAGSKGKTTKRSGTRRNLGLQLTSAAAAPSKKTDRWLLEKERGFIP